MIRIFALVIVTTVASLTGSASASSLAGHEGDVRRKPFFPMSDVTTGGCRSLWKEYVGASGHSAYASTLDAWPVEAVICGGVINSSSKRSAESQALTQCNAGLKYYKMKVMRKCQISASK